MSRFVSLIFTVLILFSLAACVSESAPVEQTPTLPDSSVSDKPQSVTPEGVNNIHVEIKDLQSNLNQWHRFSLDVAHSTNKYLTAEVCGKVFNNDGTLLGEKTVFINNLGPAPSDWVSEPFLAKGAAEYKTDYEIVSFSFTDGFPVAPEITGDNVKDYLRLTKEDLGDILGDDKEISVAIHNLTPLYYSGTITFVVSDQQGAELLTESVDFKNLKPYSDTEKLLFFPIVDMYEVNYLVDDFQFSDEPVA